MCTCELKMKFHSAFFCMFIDWWGDHLFSGHFHSLSMLHACRVPVDLWLLAFLSCIQGMHSLKLRKLSKIKLIFIILLKGVCNLPNIKFLPPTREPRKWIQKRLQMFLEFQKHIFSLSIVENSWSIFIPDVHKNKNKMYPAEGEEMLPLGVW